MKGWYRDSKRHRDAFYKGRGIERAERQKLLNPLHKRMVEDDEETPDIEEQTEDEGICKAIDEYAEEEGIKKGGRPRRAEEDDDIEEDG